MTLKDGKTAGGEIFADVDWSRTSAFAFGLNSLCLNRKNRERSGILEADQVPELKAELARKLKALTDEGRPVVQEVYDQSSPDGPGPEGQPPDLIIGYTGEYRSSWQTAVGEAPGGSVIEPNLKKWSGDHCCDPKFVPGIFLTNARNLIKTPHVKDLCPAILDYLDRGPRSAAQPHSPGPVVLQTEKITFPRQGNCREAGSLIGDQHEPDRDAGAWGKPKQYLHFRLLVVDFYFHLFSFAVGFTLSHESFIAFFAILANPRIFFNNSSFIYSYSFDYRFSIVRVLQSHSDFFRQGIKHHKVYQYYHWHIFYDEYFCILF